MRLALLLTAVLFALAAASPLFAAGRAMTVDDLLAVKGVSDPQLSPSGESIVYVVSEVDRAADKTNTSLWLAPAEGGPNRRLTTTPGTNNHPRWSPDGKTIAFVSNRGGTAQVWLLPIDGGEPRQLTKLPIDVSGPIWSPKGDRIAFTAEVCPDTTPERTAARDKEKEAAKSKTRIYDHLMVRHWNVWNEGKFSHLFVADVSTGDARDLTPKLRANVPPAPFGGSSDYAWSPDGQELAFTAEPTKHPAWSTNTDIWTVPASGGEAKNITAANQGGDGLPLYSPDGRWIAHVSQARAGFEADQWTVQLRNRKTGATFPLTQELDRPVHALAFAPGRSELRAIIDDSGAEPVVAIRFSVENGEGSATVKPPRDFPRLVKGGVQGGLNVGGKDGALVFVRHDATAPPEVFRARADGSGLVQLSHQNAPLLSQFDRPKLEGFSFEGADGDTVHGWAMRPPGFEEGKKYPVLFLVHGGPQGAWHDEWHNRWNYQLFAAPGYALVAINPRGSTGYGQTFTDQISRDWTGRVYDDLMKGLDHALKSYPFLDGARIAACGGSYGGYMVNWIAGHTDRFQALVSHAGVFDLASMYGTTEELWFPEWELGGPPWKSAEHYRERSPSTYVENFKTPTLVIHGALDFRVPDAQGLGMFTSLQRMGVPSRYLWFPDEGHWITKPANRVVWWDELHRWLGQYLKH